MQMMEPGRTPLAVKEQAPSRKATAWSRKLGAGSKGQGGVGFDRYDAPVLPRSRRQFKTRANP